MRTAYRHNFRMARLKGGMCKWHVIVLSVVVYVFAGSCIRRDVLDAEGVPREVDVKFEWGKARGAKVEGMTVFFFPVSNGGKVWRFEIGGMEGGRVEVPSGEYRMIAVNNDLDGMRLSDENSYSTLAANTVPLSQDADISRPVGMLYGCIVPSVTVDGCGVTYTASDGSRRRCPYGLLRCSPDSMSTVYNIRLEEMRGVRNVRDISALISGLSSRLNLSTAVSSGSRTSAEVDMERTASATCIGHTIDIAPPRDETSLELVLTATMADGKRYMKTFDISNEALNSPSPRNVNIILTGLDFSGDGSSSSDGNVGLDVGVDGWKEVEISYDTSEME